ncbi:MAG: GntR domain protein [Ilumatobacteraceae bacterium]|nr:GntR domain protein [Ilumatobacteraceae bacterium]MCU1387201.1 GntR domain protein [Ilumatobacteraceae bacterium]
MATNGAPSATKRSLGSEPERRPPSRDGNKLAASLADRIVADIAELGWPEGRVLGSESDLLQRYGISRAVFREAARLVELQHVARMRRGPGGGLIVAAPSVDAIVDVVSVYLYFVGANVDELFEARIAVESAAAALAPDRLEERWIERIRALVERERTRECEDHREFHRLVASVSGNPAIELFVELLNRATYLFLAPRTPMSARVINESAQAHAAIASAVLAGNGGLASSRMRKHLDAEGTFLRRRRVAPAGLADLPQIGRTTKLPEVTARKIFDEVVERGWPVGELLGSGPDLMARYGVSRGVLREAVRLLEYLQIARMRRGPGGGLFVTAPGVEATTEAIALHVERNEITPSQLFEVRTAVEMAVLDRVLDLPDDAVAPRLHEALAAERAASRAEFVTVGHDLHRVLAEVSGNHVLQLLTQVLVTLTRRRATAPDDAVDRVPAADITLVHSGLVDAIVQGDRALARLRARQHLVALERWVR